MSERFSGYDEEELVRAVDLINEREASVEDCSYFKAPFKNGDQNSIDVDALLGHSETCKECSKFSIDWFGLPVKQEFEEV